MIVPESKRKDLRPEACLVGVLDRAEVSIRFE